MQPLSVMRKYGPDAGYWLVLYTALWLLLSGGEGWGFGLILIIVATLLSFLLQLKPLRMRLFYLPRFLGFFLRELVAGGWDVARRAFLPRLPLDPAWVEYPFSNACPRNRMLLSTLVGLLPGTLASRIDADNLHIHVLDKGLPWRHNVAQLEQVLGKLLGEHSP